jgi:hypothetical protein
MSIKVMIQIEDEPIQGLEFTSINELIDHGCAFTAHNNLMYRIRVEQVSFNHVKIIKNDNLSR